MLNESNNEELSRKEVDLAKYFYLLDTIEYSRARWKEVEYFQRFVGPGLPVPDNDFIQAKKRLFQEEFLSRIESYIFWKKFAAMVAMVFLPLLLLVMALNNSLLEMAAFSGLNLHVTDFSRWAVAALSILLAVITSFGFFKIAYVPYINPLLPFYNASFWNWPQRIKATMEIARRHQKMAWVNEYVNELFAQKRSPVRGEMWVLEYSIAEAGLIDEWNRIRLSQN